MPSAPNAPTKDIADSSDTAIAIEWIKLTGDILPILGYRLYADSGLNDNFRMVYNGINMPEVFSYMFQGKLNTFLSYRFYLTAINFNGEGPASPIVSF